MDRKAVARETLKIMDQGYYECEGQRVSIQSDMDASIGKSRLITPDEGAALLERYGGGTCTKTLEVRVENLSTVDAIRKLSREGRENIGVLNFASAKNPGGGFINGAMAQEESLAASSILYRTLTAHEAYYRNNRAQTSMMYTDHAIYSPDVVFFRDGRFRLVENPVRASVLTLPAVNMGQVLLKGEDSAEAHGTGAGGLCLPGRKASGAGRLRLRRVPQRSLPDRRLVEGTVGGEHGGLF